jgi:hypothetical protein
MVGCANFTPMTIPRMKAPIIRMRIVSVIRSPTFSVSNVRLLLVVMSRDHALELYLPTLYPAHHPHPGEDLRHREGQGELVGDVVIATSTQLVFETPPVQ